jgi:radical SAM superfamily enzyme YgiQ (UPF0313 family)
MNRYTFRICVSPVPEGQHQGKPGSLERFFQAGISSTELFMVRYPGETIDNVEKMFDLVLSLPLDEAWFTVPLPIPGTPLFNRIADLASWVDWQASNQVKFVFPSEFDERWLERRIHETMPAFKKKKEGIVLGKPREGYYIGRKTTRQKNDESNLCRGMFLVHATAVQDA